MTVTVALPTAFPDPSITSTLRVFDHSANPETVPENPPSVPEIVDHFFSDPRKKLTVLQAMIKGYAKETITSVRLQIVKPTVMIFGVRISER